MSRRRKKEQKALVVRPGYEVGYGKPPEATRFKPGQSGNPRGRPKGAKNKRPGLHEERMKEIILDEAYRGISVRDGERHVTLPMAQAVMRSIAVNAARGQHRAQRLFSELLASVESANRIFHTEWLETTIGYKIEWEKELRRRKEFGITNLPDPLPHPDHVVIDFAEGTARIIGPKTKEEKAAIDYMIENKHLLFEELRDINAAKEAATNPRERRKLDELWHEKAQFIGFLNRLYPAEDED